MKMLSVALVLCLLVAGGCSFVQTLGPKGTTAFTREVNKRVDEPDKLTDSQEDAFGEAMYRYFEEAYEAAKNAIK